MKAIRSLVLACVAALAAGDALAQADLRAPLPQPLKIKQGMLNVPALSPLWLLPEEAAKYNIQIETVMFQRFADARTALVTGDIHLTAFGPQDISLALGQGAKTLVGVAGVGSGNDCLVVRKGEDIKDWKSIADKRIGIGAGSISWLKFAASVQENGLAVQQAEDRQHRRRRRQLSQGRAKQGNRHGRGVAAVLRPGDRRWFRRLSDARPQPLENRRRPDRGAGGEPAVHGEEPRRRAAPGGLLPRRARSRAQGQARWARIYAEKAGLPENVAAESIRTTKLDATLPLESIKRISKFLSDNGVITRDVSGEIGEHYDYDFLAKATGKSPDQLGMKQ